MQGYGEGAYWRDPDQGFWDAEQRDADLARAERLAERVWEPRVSTLPPPRCGRCNDHGFVSDVRTMPMGRLPCPECAA